MEVERVLLFRTCSELQAWNCTRSPRRWMLPRLCKRAEASGTFDLETVSMLLAMSSISIFISLFSFSSFCLTLCRLSICSPSSATLSACFFRSVAAVASCCRVASSRSRRSFWNSASRFLFISIWTEVAPLASSSRSLISSSSRERSERCFSILPLSVCSASTSSSSSSVRAWKGHWVRKVMGGLGNSPTLGRTWWGGMGMGFIKSRMHYNIKSLEESLATM